jgi:hypothetical protein
MGFEYRGKAVASGIVKKNRFAMEIPVPDPRNLTGKSGLI